METKHQQQIARLALLCVSLIAIVQLNWRGETVGIGGLHNNDTAAGQSKKVIVDEPPATTNCQRQCPFGRINRLVYLGPGFAGLNDRGWIVGHLMQLAGYLCATLYMRPPSHHLGAQHNDGELVSTQMRWSDIWDSRFYDGENFLHNLNVPDNWTATEGHWNKWQVNETHLEELIENNNNRHREGESSNLLNLPRNNTVDLILSRNPRQIVEAFESLAHSTAPDQQQPTQSFVWAMNRNFYKFYQGENYYKILSSLKRLDENFTDNNEAERWALPDIHCNYGHAKGALQSSLLIQFLVEQFWKRLELEYGGQQQQRHGDDVGDRIQYYGHMHLRRGDAVNQCDTTLEKIAEVLDCALQNYTTSSSHAEIHNSTSSSSSSSPLGFLFSSDERNSTYRWAVRDMVQERGHVWIDVDERIDQEVRRLLHPELRNNYFVFLALKKAMNNRVHFNLYRRRKMSCQDCPNIANRIRQSLEKKREQPSE